MLAVTGTLVAADVRGAQRPAACCAPVSICLAVARRAPIGAAKAGGRH